MNAIEFLKTIQEQNSSSVFLIDGNNGRTVTYKDFNSRAVQISAYLISIGLSKGDRAAVLASNSVSVAELYFGCLYAGITVVPINPVSSQMQVEFIIQNSKSKMLFISDDIAAKIQTEILQGYGVKIITDKDISSISVSSKNFMPYTGVEPDDDMIIVYTSGTTSEPKGVVHRISDIVLNGIMFNKALGIGSQNRFYNILSMTYLGGYYNLLIIPYIAQGSVVISNAFSAETALRFWNPIITYEVNTLWLVPTIMSILMEIDRGQEGINYCRSKIKRVLCGTAPLSQKLKVDFENKYGVHVLENFALSETLFITSNLPDDNRTDLGVGTVLDGVELKIVNNKGEVLKAGNEGEIVVKTPHLMRGYYFADGDKHNEITESEWFPTGDIGFQSLDGYLFITGRKKDLIIRGGINMSPAAIEEVLYINKSVVECAVVGLPHKIMGEEIAAVLRIKEDIPFETLSTELKKLCREKLSPIQQPAYFVELPDFPHTSSGKIQKRKIRSWLEERVKEKDKLHENKKIEHASAGIFRNAFFQPSKIAAESSQAMSIKYNTMVYEMQRKGEDVIVLSLGEAFFDIPLYSFSDLPFPAIYHYSHSRGIPELRERLSRYFLDQYDVAFDPENEILITAGSKIGIHMAMMSILNPADEVLIHEPAWVSYPEQVKLCHAVPVQIPYYVDVFDFEKYITNRTKLIIINNPNNPTGRVFSLEELSHLYRLAERYNLFVLSDEAYSDFVLEEDNFVSLGNLDSEKRHIIICNSISKNYGISGWRLGYVITNADMINQILKINQHLITCPATILEYYIEKHFDEIISITKPQIKSVVLKRKELAVYMDDIGLKYLDGTATFYFFVSIEGSKLDSERFCEILLTQHHVCGIPGIGYGKTCDKFIRISIGTESMERVKKGLDTIKKLIQTTKL